MLHTAETATCPILADPGNFHFEGRCEDCDVHRLAKINLDTVDNRYRDGRVTQAQFEAYMFLWAVLSPHAGATEWRTVPTDPEVRRIARKMLRACQLGVLSVLED